MAWVGRVLIVLFSLFALGYAAYKVLPPKLLDQVGGWLAPIGGEHGSRSGRHGGDLLGSSNPSDPEDPADPPRVPTELELWQALPKVILDPGHGGSDPGTSAQTPYEKELVLDLALRIARNLREKRIPVELTRAEDRYLDLGARVAATTHHPQALLVSLHMNGGESSQWHGIESFWCHRQGHTLPELPRQRLQQRSRQLAQLLHASLIDATEANDRGVKQANYKVLRDCSLPAVLIEVGFLSNRAERKRLEQVEYREKLAAGITEGIERAWQEQLMIPPPTEPEEESAAQATTPEPDDAENEPVEGH